MADYKPYFINPKTGKGFDELTDITREILSMENIKEGSYAQVSFKMFNADGTSYDYRVDDLGLSASSSLTGLSSGTVVQENNVTNVSVNKNAASIKNIRSFAGKLGLAQAVRTGVNFALSNYGNWTQDPLAQTDINNFKAAVQPVANIAMSTAAGGLVGFFTGVASEGASYLMDFINTQVELRRNSAQSAINRKRVGINVTNSGGR